MILCTGLYIFPHNEQCNWKTTGKKLDKILNFPFHYANGTTGLLENTNHTMRDNPFCNGMKTGYTDKSKHCLLSSGSYGGRDIIVVILGSEHRKRLFDDSAELLRWGLGLPPGTKHFMNIIHHSRTSSEAIPATHHHRRHRKEQS